MKNSKPIRRRGLARSLGQLMLVLAVVMSLALPVMAAPGYLVDIPIDTVVTIDEDEPPELLETVAVPAEFQGQSCTAVSSGNNSSVHPGNDLLVRSGGTEVRLSNVESAPGLVVVEGVGTLVLGSEISVYLDMGPDEFFSAGLVVTVECEGTPETGRIIVEKLVTEGSDTEQTFDFTASYAEAGFALTSGQTNDSGDLDPGIYSVAEMVPPGWTQSSATCDDQSPVNAIDLQAGETVTCTFTNDQGPTETGEIIVEKVVLGEGSQDFEFTFNTTGFTLSDNTLAHGQSSSSGPVAAGGGYVVSEVVPSGWQQVGAVCDNGSDPANIQVASGETVTCTFSNQIADEVAALVLVTVDSSCDVDGDGSTGVIEVEMSVPGGATVVVTDSNGSTVATFTDDGSIEVDDDATYSWVATPSAGNEFPTDFDATGSVTIEDCLETLPFTGVNTAPMAALAAMLLVSGTLLVRLRTGRHEA